MMEKINTSGLLKPPCLFCEYVGDDYWGAGSHHESCIFYAVSGVKNREKMLSNRRDAAVKSVIPYCVCGREWRRE